MYRERMNVDRVVALRIRNLRSLAQVDLRLHPLTVGIGSNGSGKSSLVEASVLLRKVATDAFMSEVYATHLGGPGLLRRGESTFSLGLDVEGAGPRLRYDIELRAAGEGLVIGREALEIDNGKKATWFRAMDRAGEVARVYDIDSKTSEQFIIAADRSLISAFTARPPVNQPAIGRLIAALNGIEVHPTLMTQPRWLARPLRFEVPMREPALLQPADRLAFGGGNLANVWSALRNSKAEQHWQTTMDYVRLGLGQDIESVNVRPNAGGGSVDLTVKRFGIDQQEPASALSEGMLAYLAHVGIYRLEAPTSLLVFDEPETHLHPRLVFRVLDFLLDISERSGVLLFTHSDRLLDALSEPEKMVVLLELDERRRTRLARPTREGLEKWKQDYSGLGQLRAAGHAASVFEPEAVGP